MALQTLASDGAASDQTRHAAAGLANLIGSVLEDTAPQRAICEVPAREHSKAAARRAPRVWMQVEQSDIEWDPPSSDLQV